MQSAQEGYKMAGTRTAPALTGAATILELSVHFIDISGDTWSESHFIPVASTAAQREAYVDALQDASVASIYKVSVNTDFGTDALSDSGNADLVSDNAKSSSVFDSLNVTIKHNTDPEKKNKIVRIPAPLVTLFTTQSGYVSDVINGESAELAAVMAAALTMFGAGWSIAWARYSEKTELNEKTRI